MLLLHREEKGIDSFAVPAPEREPIANFENLTP
jgi:hypothetical protein